MIGAKYFRYCCGFVLMASLLSGCQRQVAGAQVITEKGDRIIVEMARTPEEQAKGLMFRTTLEENAGMLFLFEKPQALHFWMKNTLIPLDILYLDESGTILNIVRMKPCLREIPICPSYPSEGLAKYALEINAGEASKLGLKPGQDLQLPP